MTSSSVAMADPATVVPAAFHISRSRRPFRLGAVVLVGLVVVLTAMPLLAGAGLISTLINLFILLTMASMWNLLAGYAGMVSVGQQAFIGAGAYLTLIFAQRGMNPFVAIPFTVIATAAIAFPVSLLLMRLRGGYFAIATWVIADVFQLVISRFPTLGGGTGIGLPGVRDIDPTQLLQYTYWASLAVVVISLGGTYLLLRGRLGLVLQAIRDDEIAARAIGGRVRRAKRIVYLVAAAGCGAAGAIVIISQLNVQPAAAFSIGWTAQMIFVTVIGGIGTLEGPIVGTIVFYALQQTLSDQGAWYLILLGVVAIAIAIWSPRGIWGFVADRLGLRLFPVGYWVTWLTPTSVSAAIRSRGSSSGTNTDPAQPVSG
jgi:branched-chain amino acid transport system permease protein